jgi:hypothetical protein
MPITAPQLSNYTVEVGIHNFLLKGTFSPRTDFFVFINDGDNATYPFTEAQLLPFSKEYQVPSIRQSLINLNRDLIAFISVLDTKQTSRLQYVQASRQVVFYTEWFAIRGELHVHGEKRDDDLLDTSHDFFALTHAEIHPLRPLHIQMNRKTPFIAINRHRVLAYNVDNKS